MSDSARGPVAPKDPTLKRPFYYIMRNKQVCGSPQKDGRGIQFIYESDGRLESSARIIGNLDNPDMIKEIGTVEGLRKQVHSVGVSVKKEGNPVTVRFAFQMYGKKDPYVSGTTHYMDLPSDGMEYVLDLTKCEWPGDDVVPGQIRFEFPEAGMTAEVSVCFYLNDGYEAPVQSDDRPIDFSGEKYSKLIKQSLIQRGNIHRIKAALEKARRGEETVVGFIGGSITQGAGAIPINTCCYAYNIFKGFCEIAGRGLEDNVKYVKAGVGGTPSELGMIRYAHDVTDDGRLAPDLMIVEFAVNDEGDETKGDCYDSLVRKIYNSPSNPAVILLFSVFADDYNLEDRLKCVGEAYNLPMVSTKAAVTPQFYLSAADGNVLSKSQFFYDCFHPTNVGHRIMGDAVLNLIKVADEADDEPDFPIKDIKPPKSADFEDVYLVDRANIDEAAAVLSFDNGAFTAHGTELQYCERDLDLQGTPEFNNNWMYEGKGGKAEFTLKVKCRRFLVVYMDSASPEVGTAEVYDNGVKALSIDPHIIGWGHCNALIVFRNDESAEHTVTIKIPEESKDKRFTVLGFGIVD